jgi:hypothetical protein
LDSRYSVIPSTLRTRFAVAVGAGAGAGVGRADGGDAGAGGTATVAGVEVAPQAVRRSTSETHSRIRARYHAHDIETRVVWSVMRGVVCGLLGVAVGCGGDGVLELVVEPPEGTATVEIYLSTHGDTEELLRPDQYGRPMPTVWWKRDRDDERDVQTVSGNAVTFAFEPGGSDQNDIHAFVAIAYDGQGSQLGMAARLTGFDIPTASEIDRYVIPLERSEPLPRSSAATLPGLQLWGPDGDGRACVHVDGVADLSGFNAQDAVIATKDDPDCDGFPDDDPLECLPRAFLAQKPPGRADLRCSISEVRVNPGGESTQMCIAGGGTCVDGLGPDPMGCHPSSYCLPTQLCATCPDLQCDQFVTNRQLITHVLCTLPSLELGSGVEQFCSGSAPLNLHSLYPQLSCVDAAKIRDGIRPWGSSLVYANNAAIMLDTLDSVTCAYTISASGDVPLIGPGVVRRDYPALFSVPLLAPVKYRGFAIPVLFQVVKDGCTSAPTCQIKVAAGETMDSCLNQPVNPDQLVAD